jgi:hypothetical protein
MSYVLSELGMCVRLLPLGELYRVEQTWADELIVAFAAIHWNGRTDSGRHFLHLRWDGGDYDKYGKSPWALDYEYHTCAVLYRGNELYCGKPVGMELRPGTAPDMAE